MFSIPNGGQRNAIIGAQLKASGTKPGVPDIFLPIARNGFHGLWIELKTDKGVVSPKQMQWLANLSAQGYANRVCFGWIEAKQALLEYLGRNQS
jgi:VRR-NUC domain